MFVQNKITMSLLIMCFALLQALAPFIHGHFDKKITGSSHHDQESGLHLSHAADALNEAKFHAEINAEKNATVENSANQHVGVHQHGIHSVSVASAIEPVGDVDSDVGDSDTAFVLLVFLFCVVLPLKRLYATHYLSLNNNSFHRLQPAPRAPPQFS